MQESTTPVAERDGELLSQDERASVVVAAQPVGKASSRSKMLNSALTLLDQAVASGSNFAAGVVIARVSKEEMGRYGLGLTVVLLLTSLQDWFVSTPYMVFSPRLKGLRHFKYNGSTLIHQLLLSVLSVVGLAIAATIMSLGYGPPNMAPVLSVISFVLAFILLKNYCRRICFATRNVLSVLALDVAVAIVQVGGLLLLFRLNLLNAHRAYWALGTACGVAGLGWLFFKRRSFVIRLDHVIGDFLRTWSFGKWVVASGLIWEVGLSLYPWILEHFHGVGATGVWVACTYIVNLGNPALLGVQNYLGPQVVHSHAEGGNAGLRSFVLRACLSFCGLVSIFSVALLILGGWLMVRVYGNKYAGNNVTLDIMAMNLVFMAASFTLARGLLALERADVDFMINMTAIVLMFTVGLWLVRLWGVPGAAVSILLANVVLVVSKYVAFMSLSIVQPRLDARVRSAS